VRDSISFTKSYLVSFGGLQVAETSTHLGAFTIQVACPSPSTLHPIKFLLPSIVCSCFSYVSFYFQHLIIFSIGSYVLIAVFNRFNCSILCFYLRSCVDLAFLSISALYLCIRI